MEKQIALIKQTRNNFIKLVDGLTIDQLNKIPAGYNNNIAWNFAHIVAAQQSLCNILSGNALKVDQAFVEKYRKGTKPEGNVDAAEIDLIKGYLIAHIEDLEKGLQNNIFAEYKQYETSYGFVLNSISDAVTFFAVHDALHFGYAMALKRAVTNI